MKRNIRYIEFYVGDKKKWTRVQGRNIKYTIKRIPTRKTFNAYQ